jgi:hypothetical protein
MHDPFEFQTRVCANGIRLLIQERPAPVQASTILFRAGSRYEDIPGTAHFLEHVISEETEQFPSFEALTEYAADLSLDVEWGATSTETIKLEVVSLPERLEAGLALLNEVIFSATLSPYCIEHEREVIVREIRETMPPEAWRAFRDSICRFFPPTHPLTERVSPLGTEETVSCINRHHLLDFRESFLGTENMYVVTAGPVPTDIVQQVIERVFARAPQGRRQIVTAPWAPEQLPKVQAGFIHVDHEAIYGTGKDREEVYSLCGFLPAGKYDPISTLLLRTMRGLLSYELRTVRKISYRSSSWQIISYPEVTWWRFHTTCSIGRIREVAETVAHILRGPTPELQKRFERAKRRALDGFAMREWTTRRIVRDSIDDVAHFDRIELEAESRGKFEQVTFDDVVRLLEYVQPEQTVRIYSCYGPVTESF